MMIYQLVEQQYEGYDVLGTFLKKENADTKLSALISDKTALAIKTLNELRISHANTYAKWTEEAYTQLVLGNYYLDILEFDVEDAECSNS